MVCNQTVICGEIIHLSVLRYTPAGIPVIDCVIRHQSCQVEANIDRHVYCELQAVAVGDTAKMISEMDLVGNVKLTGFLNRKNVANQQLILHINCIIKI